ncbi:armadillo-type protein, partial [Lentinula edodes]
MDGQGTVSPHLLLNGRENLLEEFGKSSTRKATERQTKAALYVKHAGRTNEGCTEHRQANDRGQSMTGTVEPGSTDNPNKVAGADGRYTRDFVVRATDYSGVGFAGGNVPPAGMMVEDGIPRVINMNGGYLGEATAGFEESLRGLTGQDATWNTFHGLEASAAAVSDYQLWGGSRFSDKVLKMLWSTYGGVETVHLDVTAQYETGVGRDVRVDWSVRVYLRQGQHMERESCYKEWRQTRPKRAGTKQLNFRSAIDLASKVMSSPEVLQHIKTTVLHALEDESALVGNVAGEAISTIFGILDWPECLPKLVKILEMSDLDKQGAALNAFKNMCENHLRKLDVDISGNRPLDLMIPRFLSFTDHPSVEIEDELLWLDDDKDLNIPDTEPNREGPIGSDDAGFVETMAAEWSVQKFKGELFNVLLEPLKEKLWCNDWLQQESAILAVGATAEGCHEVMELHLPNLIPYLIDSLNDSKVSIFFVVISRSVNDNWITKPISDELNGSYLSPTLERLLCVVLDDNKQVQIAGCSAFKTLAENAGMELTPYLDRVLRNLVAALN